MGCDLVHGLFAEVNDVGIFGQKEDAIKEMRTYISEGLEDHLEYIAESERLKQKIYLWMKSKMFIIREP